jgi:hypothetical protein
MQGGYSQKIEFFEIAWITYEFSKLTIIDHYLH